MIFNFLNLETSLRNNKADLVSKCFAINMLQMYSQLTNKVFIDRDVLFFMLQIWIHLIGLAGLRLP